MFVVCSLGEKCQSTDAYTSGRVLSSSLQQSLPTWTDSRTSLRCDSFPRQLAAACGKFKPLQADQGGAVKYSLCLNFLFNRSSASGGMNEVEGEITAQWQIVEREAVATGRLGYIHKNTQRSYQQDQRQVCPVYSGTTQERKLITA
jgi:hypothetical protein